MDLQAYAANGPVKVSTAQVSTPGKPPLVGVVFQLPGPVTIPPTPLPGDNVGVTVWVDPTDPGQCETVQRALLDALDIIPGAWDAHRPTEAP